MNYCFDLPIERKQTDSVKWNQVGARFGNENALPMWVADTDFVSPKPVIDALQARLDHGIFGYTYKTDEFYSSVISWFKKRHNWLLEKEWISYSPGIVTALTMLIRTFTEPGDSVLVQSPVYYPFYDIIKKNGCIISENPLILDDNHKYLIDFDDLKKKLSNEKTKMIILCSPHNPVGRVWTKDELLKVGELCLANDVLIISDEIHCDFIYGDNTFYPMMELSEEIADRTISLVAPSKTFNLAGLKTSVVISQNQNLLTKYNTMLDIHHVDGLNCFGLAAITAAYTDGAEYLDQLLAYLEGNIIFLRNFLQDNLSDIKMVEPEGTFLIWLDCRKWRMNQEELTEFFYHKAEVILSSGLVFGEPGNGFMRMNIGCSRSILKESLEKIQCAHTKYIKGRK